jgi:hypothetical protein
MALDKTLTWHQAWRSGQDMRELTLAQIGEYVSISMKTGTEADNATL